MFVSGYQAGVSQWEVSFVSAPHSELFADRMRLVTHKNEKIRLSKCGTPVL